MGTRGGRSPVRVGNLLTAAVPALAERMLEQAVRREWTETVGSEAARRTRPGALRQGTLEVSVDNSPWLQELTLRSSAIVAALRKRHGSVVTGVRFALGSGPGDSDVTGFRPPEGTVAPRRLSAEEARLVDAAAARLPDPALASSLKRLLIKDLLARGGRRAPAASEQS